MRAWEFITEGQTRNPSISLRHINRLKHENARRAEQTEQRLALRNIMYANPELEQQHIELVKARLELEQLQAEIAAGKAEAWDETAEAITDMAQSGSAAARSNEEKVEHMAKAEMRRKKKT